MAFKYPKNNITHINTNEIFSKSRLNKQDAQPCIVLHSILTISRHESPMKFGIQDSFPNISC